ncbi:MAG: prepilin-type N-terminal cleavage/methylation domain-containing protein [Actinobacteria bacterium]|nr:prepilin-type N-terminal cleavage/methylation domain-containing protein [Actinomycetota bacterium]
MSTTSPAARRDDRGATIFEIIVAIVILGIVAAVVVFAVRRMDESAQREACTSDLKTVEKALQSWAALNPGQHAVTETDLVAGQFLEGESELHDVLDANTVVPAGRCTAGSVAAAPTSPSSNSPTTPATTVAPTTVAPTTVAPTTASPTTTIPQPGAWNVITGAPTMNGAAVTIVGAATMTNQQPMGSNGTLAVSSTFTRGSGYGIWLRTALVGGAINSGFTFQWDVGYGNKFVLRLWGPERFTPYLECSVPVAVAPIPAGMQNAQPHAVSITLSGQALTASIDGAVVMTVPNLTSASKQACPNKPVPTGELVGSRTWSYDTNVTFTDLVYS